MYHTHIIDWIIRLHTFLYKHRFHAFGKGSRIHPGLNLNNPQGIAIGKQVVIGTFCWIGVNDKPAGDVPQLVIQDGCSIGAYSMIHAKQEIRLGRNVLLAPRVFIADSTYDYSDPNRPVMNQPASAARPILIEEGAFLGIGSCVLKGVRIGRNSVVGANAVVTESIPAYSVAVGNPARLVRRLHPATGRWERV